MVPEPAWVRDEEQAEPEVVVPLTELEPSSREPSTETPEATDEDWAGESADVASAQIIVTETAEPASEDVSQDTAEFDPNLAPQEALDAGESADPAFDEVETAPAIPLDADMVRALIREEIAEALSGDGASTELRRLIRAEVALHLKKSARPQRGRG
jgi:hypothetical protein